MAVLDSIVESILFPEIFQNKGWRAYYSKIRASLVNEKGFTRLLQI